MRTITPGQYDDLCEIIDAAKNDHEVVDTDEYVGRILDRLHLVQTVHVKASELRQHDVVLCHGMRVLLDSPVESTKRDEGEYGTVYWCRGLVLNIREIDDDWLVGITREYEPWPNRHIPTGEHRWSIQSNDLVTWCVEANPTNLRPQRGR